MAEFNLSSQCILAGTTSYPKAAPWQLSDDRGFSCHRGDCSFEYRKG